MVKTEAEEQRITIRWKEEPYPFTLYLFDIFFLNIFWVVPGLIMLQHDFKFLLPSIDEQDFAWNRGQNCFSDIT